MIKTKSGISKVYFVELPKEVQQRFGYDADKIEAEQAAARAAEEKRVEEQKAAQRQRAEKRGKTKSKIESNVSIERQIESKDEFEITSWSMTLRPQDIYFIRASAVGAGVVSFADPEEATDALAKFVEWDESARRNNVEPFKKSLAAKCTFEFANGISKLHYDFKYTPFAGDFSRADVDKFNELLKQLPEARAELEAKVAKAQKEEALFK